MRSIRRYILTAASAFAIAAGAARAQEPDPATEATPAATVPAATPTPNSMAPTAMPNEDSANTGAQPPEVTPLETSEAAPAQAAPETPLVPPAEAVAPVEVPVPPPAAAPAAPVKKPRVAAKKPVEPATESPKAEKSEREKALEGAAATVKDSGTPPPTSPDGTGASGTVVPQADAAPMVPPVDPPATAASARTAETASAETPAEPSSGRGAGTWVVLAILALGIAGVIRLTVRRRQVDELSIFDRSVARPTHPPVVRQS